VSGCPPGYPGPGLATRTVAVSSRLGAAWDNQSYPGIEGWLTKLVRQPDGTHALDPDFCVDFHTQTDGARPHGIDLPGADRTTEILR